MFGFFDTTYLLWVFIPTLLLSLGVQLYLRSTFKKWSNVRNSSGLTGEATAQALFSRTTLQQIPVHRTPGSLTDHFDPRSNTVILSESVSGTPSVAAMAVTAHELGHVQQYQSHSPLISVRGFLLPAVQFSPIISYICIIAGLILNMTGLVWVGIIFFGLLVVFSLLTLPVEIDASRRGLRMLSEAGLSAAPEDAQGSKAVLTAAAMTYLAAAVSAVITLIYYIALARD
jgi:uncharacterized protein